MIPETIINHFAGTDAIGTLRIQDVFANRKWQSMSYEVEPTWDVIWAYANMGVSSIAVAIGDRIADFTIAELKREANRPAFASSASRL